MVSKNKTNRSQKRRENRITERKNRTNQEFLKLFSADTVKQKMRAIKWDALKDKKETLSNRLRRSFKGMELGKKLRIGSFKSKLDSLRLPEKMQQIGINKTMMLAISFSLMMFIIGSIAMIDYVNESAVKDAALLENESLGGALVAQKNPLVVATTSITDSSVSDASGSFGNSVETQSNATGKLALNPAVSPISSARELDKPKPGDSVEVSMALSMKNLQDDIKNVQIFDSQKEVYEMLIDGKVIATFDNPDDPRQVVDKIVNRNLDASAQLLEVSYKQDFKVNKAKRSFLSLSEEPVIEDVVDYILTGTKEKHQYTIVAGDIPETIAESHGLTIDELEAANPEIVGKGHLLQIGQKLELSVPVPMLTVVTKEKAEYNDLIEFETTEEQDPNMYEGESTVKVAGVQGKKQVVAQVTRENGIEVTREILSEQVVSEPVGQVLVVGTKKAPPRHGTGTFIVPLSRGYILSSPFGYRWGGFHSGLDMACPVGTPILASDGGVVISAGWDGPYGYVVRIDHGGNFKTVYAHCSALFVSEGDRVFQGQHIANVGSTGNSTGPHVHYEVIKNGVHVNPASYIFH